MRQGEHITQCDIIRYSNTNKKDNCNIKEVGHFYIYFIDVAVW